MEPGALPQFSACVCLCGGNLALHLHQHFNDRVHVPHPWSLNGLLHLLTHWYMLHPPLDQDSLLSSIDSRLLTVAEVGSRPRPPRPTRRNVSSCIIETDGRDRGHNFGRLRIEHLDCLGYCSFFTRFALVSSYDAAWSCSASFQIFTRLLDLRSLMRFFLSFPPAVGYAFFLWLTSTIHLLSTSNLRLHLVAHLESQSLLRSIQHEVTLEVLRILLHLLPMDTNRHSRPSPCHVRCRARSSRLTQNHKKVTCGRLDRRTSPCNPSLPRLPCT